jgi:phage virion morphogenesis protein
MIDIDIPFQPVIRALRELADSVEDRRELMDELAGIMLGAVEDNFAAQGRPRWAPLHPGTIAGRRKQGTWPGQILQRSGQLAASITPHSDNNQAVVGTNKAYAAIQQFGGTTSPHVIRPKFKRALAFGGVVVRQVNHPGSKIPARPFLTLAPEDGDELVHATWEFLWRRVEQAGGGMGG